MNSLYKMFLGTPTDSERKKAADERPKVSDTDDDLTDAAPKPPPVMPTRSSFVRGNGVGRSRSLSRVYNQVPRDRPDFRRAQQDMIEYYAHLAMIETDPDRVKEENEHLQEALQGCKLHKYGRLYSRIQIACLCIDIGVRNTDTITTTTTTRQRGEDDVEEEGPRFPADLWKDMREQLIIVKSFMLRKDANADVPIQKPRYSDEDTPEENDELDAALEKHEMFQDSYHEVLTLLEAQATLTRFYEQIEAINPNAPDIVKKIESALDTYKSALQEQFLPNGDGTDTGSIPGELDSFLLHDIHSQPKEALTQLLTHVRNIFTDIDCVFSHAQLKQKMKSVLTKWSESILDIPKLVQLGYGGVMAPIVTGDEDDVSSYGVGEDNLLTQKPEDDELDAEPIPFRDHKHHGRRTSFADEARALVAGNLPARHLPMKSPRSRSSLLRRSNGGRKSPSRTARRQRDSDSSDDDDSHTQDPTATVHQYGGASKSPVERNRTQVVASPARDSDGTPSSQNKRRRPAQPNSSDDGLWEDTFENAPAQKRRTYMDWTVDETNAVKEGYATFGKRWAMIKHNCNNRLSRRTNVQIKDKWRTMVNRGEIEEGS